MYKTQPLSGQTLAVARSRTLLPLLPLLFPAYSSCHRRRRLSSCCRRLAAPNPCRSGEKSLAVDKPGGGGASSSSPASTTDHPRQQEERSSSRSASSVRPRQEKGSSSRASWRAPRRHLSSPSPRFPIWSGRDARRRGQPTLDTQMWNVLTINFGITSK